MGQRGTNKATFPRYYLKESSIPCMVRFLPALSESWLRLVPNINDMRKPVAKESPCESQVRQHKMSGGQHFGLQKGDKSGLQAVSTLNQHGLRDFAAGSDQNLSQLRSIVTLWCASQ